MNKNKSAILLSIYLMLFSTLAIAQSLPEGGGLSDLSNYVNIKKNCEQLACNTINAIQINKIDAFSKKVELTLKISARELSLSELPFNAEQVNINEIRLNNKLWYGATKQDGKYWLAVPNGLNNVQMQITLKDGLSVISLKDLKNFENLDQQSQVNLIKRNNEYFLEFDTKIENKKEVKSDTELPIIPYFILNRQLNLGNKWRMTTIISPLPGVEIKKPVTVSIPLIKGEHILSEDIKENNGNISVVLNNTPIQWNSIIDETQQLDITANNRGSYLESWNINSQKDWLFSFSGVNPNYHSQNNYQWLIWPNDKLIFNFEKPKVLVGKNLNIENYNMTANYDTQPFTYNVAFIMNSSLGGRTYIDIPKDYTVKELRVNNKVINTNNDSKIALDINSGANEIRLVLNQSADWSIITHFPKIKLPVSSVNNSYEFNYQDSDRWIIWTGGANLNPAILLWGILLSLVLFAYFLRKLPTPLTFTTWTLLLLGVSQNSIFSIIIVIGTFILAALKPIIFKETTPRLKYDMYQIILSILILISLAILLATLNHGLLFNPEIYTSSQLSWFTEQSDTASGAWFISLPLWIYHTIMFTWAIWLAFSFTKLAKWFWAILSQPQLWLKNIHTENPIKNEKIID